MATPQRRIFHLSRDGRPIAVDVRSAGGTRPAAVICGDADPGLIDRLARAGLMAVSCAGEDLDAVLAALQRGELGPRPTVIGLLGGSTAVAGIHRVPAGEADPVGWLARRLG